MTTQRNIIPTRCTVAIAVLCVLCRLSVAAEQAKRPPEPEKLRVPPGFSIDVYAKNLPSARTMTSAKVGNATIVYVGTKDKAPAGNVYYVVDRNSDGKPEFQGKLLSGLDQPNGVTLRGDELYVSGFANKKGMIWRLDNVHQYALQNKPYTGNRTVITDQLPGNSWHGLRFLRFGPDGLMVVPVGAPCNVCGLETTPEGIQYGTLYSLNVTNGKLQKIATGVRNSVGFDWHPKTGVLYFTENGRDTIGDDRPDCELNRLPSRTYTPNDPPFFGFPYCQTQGLGNPYQRNLGPGEPLPDPDKNPKNNVINCSAPGAYNLPVQALGPHTAPIGMRFYRWQDTPGAFPQSFDNTIFVVERGSWNRAMEIGKRVTLLQLDGSGRPSRYEQFAWGWLQNENTTRQYTWGRPADVEQLPDGSLLVSDDANGMLVRISYTGATAGSPAGVSPSRIENTTRATGATSNGQERLALRSSMMTLLCAVASWLASSMTL